MPRNKKSYSDFIHGQLQALATYLNMNLTNLGSQVSPLYLLLPHTVMHFRQNCSEIQKKTKFLFSNLNLILYWNILMWNFWTDSNFCISVLKWPPCKWHWCKLDKNVQKCEKFRQLKIKICGHTKEFLIPKFLKGDFDIASVCEFLGINRELSLSWKRILYVRSWQGIRRL